MKRFETLDGLRGVAAIMVLLYHVGRMTDQSWLSPYGYLAVDLFFVLSGFVIGLMYERKLAAGLGFWAYLIGIRVVRMYPMISLGAILGLLAAMIGAAHVAHPIEEFVKSLLLIPTLSGKDLFILNTVLWSLALELLANGFHAAIFKWLSKGLLVAIVTIGAVLVVAASYSYYDLDVGRSVATAFGGVARVTFSFFLGVLIFRYQSSGRLPFLRIPFGVMLVLTILFLAVPLPTLRHHIPMLHDLAAVFLVFPLTVIAGIQSDLSGRAKALAEFLEGLSYPLYSVHFPMIQMAIFVLSFGFANPIVRGAIWTAFCLVVIVMAWLIDLGVEGPFERWWKKRRQRSIY